MIRSLVGGSVVNSSCTYPSKPEPVVKTDDYGWTFCSSAGLDSPDRDSGRAGGEADEAISLAEFKDRLHATLDYLKRNERPGWQAAEQEHTRFINSIQE